MKRLSYVFYILAALLLFSGCADKSAVNVQATKQFRYYGLNNFEFSEFYTVSKYHTPLQIKNMLNKKIIELLSKKGLLSTNKKDDAIGIDAKYTRRYTGDTSAEKKSALAYPFFSYTIKIVDVNLKKRTIEKRNVPFKGTMSMNMKLIASQLADKEYEKDFVDAFANMIASDIEALSLQ
ncbi:MAG: hypothetical protein LBP54_07325 [Campylobacteraceae bacterium]|jgi:hypothetical protein|nr:hypothetical protein [Campylobacteraceae bacterium]